MEYERWIELYKLANELGRHAMAGVHSVTSDVVIYLWAAAWDRPVCWAYDSQNWPKDLLRWHLRRKLPSQSTMSRRLRSVPVMQLLERMHQYLLDQDNPSPTGCVASSPKSPKGRGGFRGDLAK